MFYDFIGVTSSRETKYTYLITQSSKLSETKLQKSECNFIFAKNRLQYIATFLRPEPSSTLHPVKSDDTDELHDFLTYEKERAEIGLMFVPLGMSSARVLFSSHSLFINALSFKSQVGYIILPRDKNGNGHILQYTSKQSRRVTRSVLAAKVLALVSVLMRLSIFSMCCMNGAIGGYVLTHILALGHLQFVWQRTLEH